jgi:hypothetical protein
MKLTKGKINKLYKKKKQSLKKIKHKNKIKNKSKRHTFRKHKKLNLARKSLKKLRGGADDPIGVNIIEKPFNSGPNRLVQTAYIIGPDGNLTIAPVQPANTNKTTTSPTANQATTNTARSTMTTNQPNNSYGTNQSVSSKNPRETAIEVVDEIYKGMHENDKQDPSKSINEFAHKLAETLPSDAPQITDGSTPSAAPQITGPNAGEQGNMQLVVKPNA